MSATYPGEATGEEPALRDVERWKDKIEVRLDNRQVFFLFFGSALCACMLFVLGVIVGKRLESRGRAAVPEVQDPLAVLDRINVAGSEGGTVSGPKAEPPLTFPKALIAAPKGRGAAPISPPGALAPGVPIISRVAPPAPSRASIVAAKTVPSSLPKAPVPVATKGPGAGPPRTALTPLKSAALSPRPGSVAVAVPAGPPAATKGKLALQLSSFPDRDEADAFAKRFAAQGAYVVVSEIPGKGTWYRVRVGSYGTSQEAIAAKGTFEKQTNVIAYIAGR